MSARLCRIIGVVCIVGFGSIASAGDITLEALNRDRFGQTSVVSFDSDNFSIQNFSGQHDITMPMGKAYLSLRGSWQSIRDSRAFVNPQYFFLTQPLAHSTISAGIGYDYNETNYSTFRRYITNSGLGFAPFDNLHTTINSFYELEWSRQHSFKATVNDIFHLSSDLGLIAGIEASYSTRQGFRYEEKSQTSPSTSLARYFDYNSGTSGELGISTTLGLWYRSMVMQRRLFSLVRVRWDLNHDRSMPVYSPFVAPEAIRLIQYAGNNNLAHFVELSYTASDDNPYRQFFTFARNPVCAPPMLSIKKIGLTAYCNHSDFTVTYVNHWKAQNEWGMTGRQFISTSAGIAVDGDLRCYFLRYAYVQVSGKAESSLYPTFFDLTVSGAAGAGLRLIVENGGIVDLSCSVLNGVAAQTFRVALELSLLDMNK